MNHLKQIAARLPEYGLDAMLLNSEPGEYYAVGFHGEGNVVVTAQGCFYFTDSRYIEAANHLITGAEIAMTGRSRNYRAMVQEVVDRCRIRKLGFEEGYLSVADYNLWKEGLTAELVPAQKLVDALRARYGRDRLFLLGHSWGSLLGGLYALRRPEKLSAWLPVSQMVDFKRSEQVSAAEAIRRARGAGREEDAERLAQELEQVLAQADQIQQIARDFAGRDDVFFIGRNLDYALSMEGSLKLKEISYIHSEAYASGELKHGTISLIEDGTLVIALGTYTPLFDKAMSNVVEVKSRGADVLGLTVESRAEAMKKTVDHAILVPDTHPMLLPSLDVLPMQLFAYYVALMRGCDIDKPRNLAKSVTVE